MFLSNENNERNEKERENVDCKAKNEIENKTMIRKWNI